MRRIVVPDDYPAIFSGSAAEEKLEDFSRLEVFTSKPETAEELSRRVQGAEGVVNIRAFCKFDADFFSSAADLQILSIWGTGTDHVDLEAARRSQVTVSNTPGVAAASVAEHTLALMLAAARHIPENDRAVRGGSWPRGEMTQLNGKTLGLVGLGAIGRRTAEIAKGVGMKLVAWTFHPDDEFAQKLGIRWVDLDTLYEVSDVVSLHVRQSAETIGMVDEKAFARMRPGTILVNTARGSLIDEDTLIGALKSGRIAAAGLDVFTEEPISENHPLTKLPNVVISPHNAGITPEVTERGLLLCAENVISFFEGSPQNVVG